MTRLLAHPHRPRHLGEDGAGVLDVMERVHHRRAPEMAAAEGQAGGVPVEEAQPPADTGFAREVCRQRQVGRVDVDGNHVEGKAGQLHRQEPPPGADVERRPAKGARGRRDEPRGGDAVVAEGAILRRSRFERLATPGQVRGRARRTGPRGKAPPRHAHVRARPGSTAVGP